MSIWSLAVLFACWSAVAGITVPMRRQQPMRHLHRFGGSVPVIRVRNGPVKRIYVPMNVLPQQQRFVPSYEPLPSHWKHKPMVKVYHQGGHHLPQVPNRSGNQQPWNMGPMRKARNPKPKYTRKPIYKYPKVTPIYDSYKPQPVYNSPVLTDSYGAPKTSYQLTAPTYGKPHPAGSPEPPKDKIKEDTPTSYLHVYQGEKATKEGKPTYGYSQSHASYEDNVKSSTSPKVTNHRPVYKPKADTVVEETKQQGSFQPPKQTYGFTPYEETLKESAENYSPTYYKKQPDTVLSPNYFDQNKS